MTASTHRQRRPAFVFPLIAIGIVGISVLTVLAESRARDARLARAESKSQAAEQAPGESHDGGGVVDPFAIVLGDAPDRDSAQKESAPKQPTEEFFPIPEGAEPAPELAVIENQPPWLKADQDGQLAGSLMILASESAEQGDAQAARSTRMRALQLYETSLAHTSDAFRFLARKYGSKSKLVLALKAKRRTWEGQVRFIGELLTESEAPSNSNSSTNGSAASGENESPGEAQEQTDHSKAP